MIQEKTKKKKITATLRTMKVGDIEVFPYSQYPSMLTTMSRLRLSRVGDYKMTATENDGLVIQRIA